MTDYDFAMDDEPENTEEPDGAGRSSSSSSSTSSSSSSGRRRRRRSTTSKAESEREGDENGTEEEAPSRGRRKEEDLPIASRRPARARAKDEEEEVGRERPAERRAEAEEREERAPSRSRGGRTTRRAEPREDGAPDVDGLVTAIGEMRDMVGMLAERVDRASRRDRVGIFVDVPNILYGAERVDQLVDMGKLLTHLTRGRELVRATAYAPVSDNPAEPVEKQKFVAPFVPYAYRIVTKPLKRFQDGSIKGNFDVEMAVDMVTMASRLDVICIVSGDADFAKAVEYVQQQGIRVEVVAFAGSSSVEMRALADEFIEVGSILDALRPEAAPAAPARAASRSR